VCSGPCSPPSLNATVRFTQAAPETTIPVRPGWIRTRRESHRRLDGVARSTPLRLHQHPRRYRFHHTADGVRPSLRLTPTDRFRCVRCARRAFRRARNPYVSAAHPRCVRCRAQPERSLPRDSRPVSRSTRCVRNDPDGRVLISAHAPPVVTRRSSARVRTGRYDSPRTKSSRSFHRRAMRRSGCKSSRSDTR